MPGTIEQTIQLVITTDVDTDASRVNVRIGTELVPTAVTGKTPKDVAMQLIERLGIR